MLSPQQKAYVSFYDSARHNEVFDSKTTIMIHLATAMAVGCYPWMEEYLGVAREEGLSEKEIGAIQAIVMAVSAGRVGAQVREVRRKMRETEDT